MNTDYDRVEQAMGYVLRNYRHQPSLAEIAASVHLSEYHFQRLFQRWAGVSPKQFLRYITLVHAKRCLADSASVLEAAYATGLSGPGRMHELFVSIDAVTPGDHRRRGAGLEVRYGFHDGPFGRYLLLVTARGICGLAFVTGTDQTAALADMQARWDRAQYLADPDATGAYAARIFQATRPRGGKPEPLRLYLRGRQFQVKVWEALLRIPAGACTTYSALARHIGHPRAARAVANAVAQNPISFLIPCHRVIRRDGLLGGYHWGTERKLALLGWESSNATHDAGNSVPLQE